MHKITIETDPKLTGLSNNRVENIIKHVLNKESISESKITLIFGDKALLRSLKKEFFNIDVDTDVIAFRLNEYSEKNIDGEIYICLPVAKENAELYKDTYEREIARLIIHGGLHLIDYDDSTEEDRNAMRKLENKYLKELEI
jgi:rRNA maturation RNase YbeY